MRALLLSILVACGGGSTRPGVDSAGIHTIVTCDASWGGEATECELACKVKPSGTPIDRVCTTHLAVSEAEVDCSGQVFNIEGRQGCCVTNFPGFQGTALFGECE